MKRFLTYDEIVKLDPLAFGRPEKRKAKPTPKRSVKFSEVEEAKERERVLEHIQQSKCLNQLAQVRGLISQYDLGDEYQARFDELTE